MENNNVINGFKIKNQNKKYQNLICSICYDIYMDPVSLKKCKHIYCKRCIEKTKKKGYLSCPLCRERNIEYDKSDDLNKLINNIKVFCKNKNCKYILKYEDNKKHTKICYYEHINCIYCKYSGIRKHHNIYKCNEYLIER